ncbi:MAG: heavy metal-binding domain-containing protein [Actinobacteria bacterium]|nr:heavy metal-binding domain-containing protein [Actinomycetota bacterium]MCA1720624.1 heavy metal-binding domain-containing protein [Actinomycetota bacterium]
MPDHVQLSERALERLAELGPTAGRQLFTSDLSVNEFLLVRSAGFRPLGLVLGCSIFHVGLQFRRWGTNQELTTLTSAMYAAREQAMARLEAEADALGADGVVGVRLTVEHQEWGNDLAEFVAVGTAVIAERGTVAPAEGWLQPSGLPFTSDLTGQDFWTLLQTGYAPLGLVLGNCVYHVAHRSLGNVLSTITRNQELPQFTQALYDARELAMERMQAEAEALGAEGIVGVDLRQTTHRWGTHTTEFLAIGTAVRPIRPDHQLPAPQLTLGLD